MTAAPATAPEPDPSAGYVMVTRASLKDPIFNGDIRLWNVWNWALLTAQSEPYEMPTKFGKIPLDVGELLIAEAPLALRFGVSRRQIGQFLDRLVAQGKVIRKPNSKCHRAGTVIAIQNFQQYQYFIGDIPGQVIRKANDNRSVNCAENYTTLLYNNVDETGKADAGGGTAAEPPAAAPVPVQVELAEAVIEAGGPDFRNPTTPCGPPAPPEPEVLERLEAADTAPPDDLFAPPRKTVAAPAQQLGLLDGPSSPVMVAVEMSEIFNRYCPPKKRVRAQAPGKKRIKAANTVLKEAFGGDIAAWEEFCQTIADLPVIWKKLKKICFDWFLSADNVNKVLEGNFNEQYNDGGQQTGGFASFYIREATERLEDAHRHRTR